MSRRRSLGGIQILSELSRGGMGEVLLGRKVGAHGFEKLVAVKTIKRELFGRDDVRKMFLDEARIMARLDHPSIVQVHDFGEDDGLLYLAMEYVAGAPLSKLVEPGPVPASVAARIVADVCRGLHAAHELKSADERPLHLVHRDVSPQNLVLTFEGRIKILDFGVALVRNREAPVTEIGRIKGKAAYLAPEQLDGSRIDRRADLYAAGVVLYELLTGRRLFDVDTLDRPTLAPPSRINPEVPPELDHLVMRALASDPDQRFADGREMATALEEAVRSAPATLLADYAEERLEEERRAHEVQIRALLSGLPAPPPTPARRGGTLVEESLSSVRPIEATTSPIAAHRRGRPRGRWLAAVLAAGLVTGGAIALSLIGLHGEPPPAAPIIIEPVAPAAEVRPPPAKPADPTGPTERDAPPPPPAIAKRVARPRRSEPPKREAPPPEPKGVGFVTVGADPFGIVVIDGADLGVSPVADHRLEEGEHEISLLHPTTRVLLRSKRITLHPGQRLTVKL